MTIYAEVNEKDEVVSYPLTEYDIKKRYPNTSFIAGKFIPPDKKYVEVKPVDVPTLPWYQWVEGNYPTKTSNNEWEQTWIIKTLNDEAKEIHIGNLKKAKNAEINMAWKMDNQSSFNFHGKEVKIDDSIIVEFKLIDSAFNICDGAPPYWPIGYKAMDNTWIPISTLGEWREFYLAFYTHRAKNFLKAQDLKVRLNDEECNTPARIKSIKW